MKKEEIENNEGKYFIVTNYLVLENILQEGDSDSLSSLFINTLGFDYVMSDGGIKGFASEYRKLNKHVFNTKKDMLVDVINDIKNYYDFSEKEKYIDFYYDVLTEKLEEKLCLMTFVITGKKLRLHIEEASNVELLELQIEIDYGTYEGVYEILDRLLNVNKHFKALAGKAQELRVFYQQVYNKILSEINGLMVDNTGLKNLLRNINDFFDLEIDFTASSFTTDKNNPLYENATILHCVFMEHMLFEDFLSLRDFFIRSIKAIRGLPHTIAENYQQLLMNRLDELSSFSRNSFFPKISKEKCKAYHEKFDKSFYVSKENKLATFFRGSTIEVNPKFFHSWSNQHYRYNFKEGGLFYLLPVFIAKMVDYKIPMVVDLNKQQATSPEINNKLPHEDVEVSFLFYNLMRLEVLFFDDDVVFINEISLICERIIASNDVDQIWTLLCFIEKRYRKKITELGFTLAGEPAFIKILSFINHGIMLLIEEDVINSAQRKVREFSSLFSNFTATGAGKIFHQLKEACKAAIDDKLTEKNPVMIDEKESQTPVVEIKKQSLADSSSSPTKNSIKEKRREEQHAVLAIDGGGIRGLIPAIVSRELESRLNYPLQDCFDTMIGTSTGGIIASALSMTQPLCAEDIVKIYSGNKRRAIFPRSWAVKSLVTTRYPRTGIDAVLKNTFGDNDFSDTHGNLLLTSVYKEKSLAESGAINLTDCVFTKEGIYKIHEGTINTNAPISTGVVKLWDACGASSAAPTYFPNKVIKDGVGQKLGFYDGGLENNEPSYIGYKYVVDVLSMRKDSVLLVNLGTGASAEQRSIGRIHKYFLNRGKLPWITPAIGKFSDAANNKTNLIKEAIDVENRYLFRPKFPGKIGLDSIDNKSINKLWHTAMVYIEKLDETNEINKLCERLLSTKEFFSDFSPKIIKTKRNESHKIDSKLSQTNKMLCITPREIAPYLRPGRYEILKNDFKKMDTAISNASHGIYLEVCKKENAKFSAEAVSAHEKGSAIYFLLYTEKPGFWSDNWTLMRHDVPYMAPKAIKIGKLTSFLKKKKFSDIEKTFRKKVEDIIIEYDKARVARIVHQGLQDLYDNSKSVPNLTLNLLNFRIKSTDNKLHHPHYTGYHTHPVIAIAAGLGYTRGIKFLLEQGGGGILQTKSTRDWSLVHWAAANNETHALYLLYCLIVQESNGDARKVKEFLTAENTTGRTPLYLAESSSRNQLQAARLLRYLLGMRPVEWLQLIDSANLKSVAQPVSNEKSRIKEALLDKKRSARIAHVFTGEIEPPVLDANEQLLSFESKLFLMWREFVNVKSQNPKANSSSSLILHAIADDNYNSGQSKIGDILQKKKSAYDCIGVLEKYNAALYASINAYLEKIQDYLGFSKKVYEDLCFYNDAQLSYKRLSDTYSSCQIVKVMPALKSSYHYDRPNLACINSYIDYYENTLPEVLITKKKIVALCQAYPILRFIHYCIHKYLLYSFCGTDKNHYEYYDFNDDNKTIKTFCLLSLPFDDAYFTALSTDKVFDENSEDGNNSCFIKLLSYFNNEDLRDKVYKLKNYQLLGFIEKISDLIILQYYPTLKYTTASGCDAVACYCAAHILAGLSSDAFSLDDFDEREWIAQELPHTMLTKYFYGTDGKVFEEIEQLPWENTLNKKISLNKLFSQIILVVLNEKQKKILRRPGATLEKNSFICFAIKHSDSRMDEFIEEFYYKWEKLTEVECLVQKNSKDFYLYRELLIGESSVGADKSWCGINSRLDKFIKNPPLQLFESNTIKNIENFKSPISFSVLIENTFSSNNYKDFLAYLTSQAVIEIESSYLLAKELISMHSADIIYDKFLLDELIASIENKPNALDGFLLTKKGAQDYRNFIVNTINTISLSINALQDESKTFSI